MSFDKALEIVFAVIAHLLIVGGLGASFYLIFASIARSDTQMEKLMRTLSLTTALLIFFGARAAGFSIADFMGRALGLPSLWFALVGVAFPSGVGCFLAWYILQAAKKHDAIAMRVLLLVSTFIVVEFGEVYLVAIGKAGLPVGRDFMPNISFTVGLGLYLVLNQAPQRKS